MKRELPDGLVIETFDRDEIKVSSLNDLNRLLSQLFGTAKPLSLYRLSAVVMNPCNKLYIVRDPASLRIIAMTTCIVNEQVVGRIGHIEDVATDQAWRSKGIASALIAYILGDDHGDEIRHWNLTTKPERGAIELYNRLGFETRGTVVMRCMPDTVA